MKRSVRIIGGMIGWFGAAFALQAEDWRILEPASAPKVYAIAAAEFQKYYADVTGKRLEVTKQADPVGNWVVIGSDSVNGFCRTAVEQHIISPLGVGAETDDYCIRSAEKDGRRYLFLAGGCGRATLYAVYDFFERQAGCRWFWDGDIVPKKDSVEMGGLDVHETPRFTYRGLRYFAHRSLDRFQAEHWGPEQWDREIDWVLKKRLNLFMLRIGMDDVWQKAFPDIVPYPPTNAPLPEAVARSYDDRTSAWPLQYRGELRRHILNYARDRGLIHPEDTGTMTHWYSRTPYAFLEKAKPVFSPQVSGYGLPTGFVWDIRDDRNLDTYWKLTQTHIDTYGGPQMFHTIGYAERVVYKDRAENHAFKLYAYRRIIEKLREHYPQAPLLIASWDFYYPGWSGENVSDLLKMLNPENTLIFDYTSDLPQTGKSSDFRQWEVSGKFPWIFGIFHAYEWQNDLRGYYGAIRERMPLAAADPMCKGFVYWPENSHSDPLVLEFFTRNAWRPDTLTPEELLPSFCRDRYPHAAEPMLAAWQAALPLIKLHDMLPLEFRNPTTFAGRTITTERTAALRKRLSAAQPYMEALPSLCEKLAALPYGTGDAFVDRDAIDLARTVTARTFSYALYRYIAAQDDWLQGRADAATVNAAGDRCMTLLTTLRDLLALHDDYSLNASMAKLRAVQPVNPCFEQTLKGNAENGYCRTYIYELFDDYYLPQWNLYTQWVGARVANGDTRTPRKPENPLPMKPIADAFYAKPLSEMAPRTAHTREAYQETMKRLSEQAAHFER